jgi:hypothetical protein
MTIYLSQHMGLFPYFIVFTLFFAYYLILGQAHDGVIPCPGEALI